MIEAIGIGLYFKTCNINDHKILWFLGIHGAMKTFFLFWRI